MLKQSTVILKMAKARQYYTEFERSLLRELVSKQLHVVENKKTDFASIKKKSDVWVNLAKQFNAEIGVQQRNDKQLNKCCDNMKTRAKNDNTKERRERLQTDTLFIIPTLFGEEVGNMYYRPSIHLSVWNVVHLLLRSRSCAD